MSVADEKWDRRFLGLAEYVAQWSKDRTKVGAVIVRPNRSIVSVGFNGFPMKVDDSGYRYSDREFKLKVIVHAERNALLFAQGGLEGCTMYTWPFSPCAVCAGMIIQVGIVRCVTSVCPEEVFSRWGQDLVLAKSMLYEAGIYVDEYD